MVAGWVWGVYDALAGVSALSGLPKAPKLTQNQDAESKSPVHRGRVGGGYRRWNGEISENFTKLEIFDFFEIVLGTIRDDPSTLRHSGTPLGRAGARTCVA